jgi:hypothetical protein
MSTRLIDRAQSAPLGQRAFELGLRPAAIIWMLLIQVGAGFGVVESRQPLALALEAFADIAPKAPTPGGERMALPTPTRRGILDGADTSRFRGLPSRHTFR